MLGKGKSKFLWSRCTNRNAIGKGTGFQTARIYATTQRFRDSGSWRGAVVVEIGGFDQNSSSIPVPLLMTYEQPRSSKQSLSCISVIDQLP